MGLPLMSKSCLSIYIYENVFFLVPNVRSHNLYLFQFYRMGNQVPLMKRDDQIMNSLARESANPIIERQLVTFYDEEEAN